MRPILVVTTTYNELSVGALPKSVDALHKSAGIVIKHVIVDNGSKDGTAEWLASNRATYGYDYYVLKNNVGVSRAHNYIWRQHRGYHYVKLDADTITETPNWLAVMTKIAEENSMIVGAIGLDLEPKTVKYAFEPITLSNYKCRRKLVGNIGGACIFIPNYVNEFLGYWDELSTLYGEEDALMGCRIAKLGRLNLYLDDFKAHCEENLDPAYIAWKNAARAENTKTNGEYPIRYHAYMNGTRNLYQP